MTVPGTQPAEKESEMAKYVITADMIEPLLLRFDIGAVKSKWGLDSEANIRKALGVAEASAPAITVFAELDGAK